MDPGFRRDDDNKNAMTLLLMTKTRASRCAHPFLTLSGDIAGSIAKAC
jgi:hypothetical protein